MGGPMLPQSMETWVRHVNRKIAEFDRHRHPADTASVGDLEQRVSTLETEVGQLDTAVSNLAATVAANILADHFASGEAVIPGGTDGIVVPVSFGKTFAAIPRVTTTARSSTSSKAMIAKVANITATGFDMVGVYSGDANSWFTNHPIQWIATDIA